MVSNEFDLALVKAFVLHHEYELSAYDWAGWTLIELCEKEPMRAYRCIVDIAALEMSSNWSAVMCGGSLKLLLELHGQAVLPLLKKDLETITGLRYALAAALSFGVYTGKTQLDEIVASLDARYGLVSLIRRFYEEDSETIFRSGSGFVFSLQDLQLSFCPAVSAEPIVLFEARHKGAAENIRMRGRLSAGEQAKLIASVEDCLDIEQKTRRFVLGSGSFVECVLDCQSTGQLGLRVNFWIDGFVMPQMINVQADQSHLQYLVEGLRGLSCLV